MIAARRMTQKDDDMTIDDAQPVQPGGDDRLDERRAQVAQKPFRASGSSGSRHVARGRFPNTQAASTFL